MRTVVIIPAFNEEDVIAQTVRAALEITDIDEVLVVDDGSTDGTGEVARTAGARLISLPENSGKGAALNVAVAQVQADIYLIIDADLGECAIETHRLLEPVLKDFADMSIAIMRAPSGHKGGFGFVMRLAKWAVRKYGGMEVSAPISGQRAIRAQILRDIGGFEERFGAETALTIDALRKGYRIVEVELPLTHRLSGRNLSGFLHRGRQFVDISKAVWKRRGRGKL